jgi:DNA integrity scanning protein DisA with diadenylate cyclase activity
MIFAFGAKLLLGLGLKGELAKRFAWAPPLIIAALLVFLIMRIAANWFEQAIDTAKDAGAVEAVVAGQTETLNQLEDANNAEQDLRSADERNSRRFADCLRDSREKGRCERYNPAGK